jgi:flagellar biogenesis protein FliO
MTPWRQSETQWARTTLLRSFCRQLIDAISRIWRVWSGWRQRSVRGKQLRVRETLSLGERRFVAVLECDERRFLIGGTGASISILADLTSAGDNTKATSQAEDESRGAA